MKQERKEQDVSANLRQREAHEIGRSPVGAGPRGHHSLVGLHLDGAINLAAQALHDTGDCHRRNGKRKKFFSSCVP